MTTKASLKSDLIDSYEKAVVPRIRTSEDIRMEMEAPEKTNFALYEYHLPNGVVLGVFKSKIKAHPAFFQILPADTKGKNAFKIDEQFSGEYTSVVKAERDAHVYCERAWNNTLDKRPKKNPAPVVESQELMGQA